MDFRALATVQDYADAFRCMGFESVEVTPYGPGVVTVLIRGSRFQRFKAFWNRKWIRRFIQEHAIMGSIVRVGVALWD